MTKTKTPAALAADDLDVQSLMDHLNTRRREIAIGAVVVAVVAGGILLWRLSISQKNARADQALTQATNAFYNGNRPLAATPLQALADRYRDTPAGVEGAMILAQMDFEVARWADGLKDIYQGYAARILTLAGKKDAARKIWADLASRPESPLVAEAKVRLR